MKKKRASRLLEASLDDLMRRQGQITVGDLEKEVINLACLEVLKKRRTKSFGEEKSEGVAINLDAMIEHATQEPKEARSVATAFAEAALEMVPEYTQKHAENAKVGVRDNCSWDGMWNFLEDYFYEKHGRDIASEVRAEQEQEERGWIEYKSSRQKHYSGGEHSHDTRKTVVIRIRRLAGDYILVETPDHPDGLEVEHANSMGTSHSFVSDNLLHSFIVDAKRPTFTSVDEIVECQMMQNRTSDMIRYQKG